MITFLEYGKVDSTFQSAILYFLRDFYKKKMKSIQNKVSLLSMINDQI